MATTITANGINFPDGSAGSPSIGGTDTNTGLFTGSDIVGFATGGSERLRIDASGNINIANDSGKLQLGTGADLQIYHNGTHSYLDNSTGYTFVRSNSVSFNGAGGSETMAAFVKDGACELYYDNTKKFETTAAGSKISTGVLDFPDSVEARFGTGGDMKISHDGSNSKIHHGGSGGLKITTADFQVQNGAGSEWIMRGQADGGVDLYYDNSKKAFTGSTGFNVSGNCDLVNDNDKLQLGNDADIQIYHTGSYSYIDNTHSGGLWIRGGAGNYNVGIQAKNSQNSILCTGDSSVDLYHNGTLQCYTAADGLAFPSGKGINFNATADASGTGVTAGSETLDDYEEGTFSPTFNGSSGGTNIGYGVNVGNYTKIGNMVSIEIYLNVDTVHANGSGHLRIGGLPFTKTSRYGGLNISYMYGWNGTQIKHALVDVNSTQIYLYNLNTSSGSNYYSDTLTVAGVVTSSTEIMLNGIYFTS